MKRLKFWSILMLAVMLMPVTVSCSSSDDNKSSEYTSDEIVKLLTGKWVITGDVIITQTETGKKMEGDYDGTIEFKESQSFNRSITANCTHNDFPVEGYSDDELLQKYVLYFLDNYKKYTITKKNGKNYISFKGSINCDFEIINLEKTSMRLILDDNISSNYDDNIKTAHIYMTIISQ